MIAAYAKSAELAARRVAHIINTTAGVREAADIANNAGRVALRKCVACRTVAAETGAEIIALDAVIADLETAIEAANVNETRAYLADYRDAARRVA